MRSQVIKINWRAGRDKLRYQPVLYMWVYFTRITSQFRKAGNNQNDTNARADKQEQSAPFRLKGPTRRWRLMEPSGRLAKAFHLLYPTANEQRLLVSLLVPSVGERNLPAPAKASFGWTSLLQSKRFDGFSCRGGGSRGHTEATVTCTSRGR